jgi:hypothetical protein
MGWVQRCPVPIFHAAPDVPGQERGTVIDVWSFQVSQKAPRAVFTYCKVGEETQPSVAGAPRYSLNFAASCATPEQLPAEREWVRSLFNALRPHMLGAGAYINILAEGEDARIQETYGAKFDRLQMIKNKYDPNNVFRRNANIRPAAATGS